MFYAPSQPGFEIIYIKGENAWRRVKSCSSPNIERSRGMQYREACGVSYSVPLGYGLLAFSLVSGNCRCLTGFYQV